MSNRVEPNFELNFSLLNCKATWSWVRWRRWGHRHTWSSIVFTNTEVTALCGHCSSSNPPTSTWASTNNTFKIISQNTILIILIPASRGTTLHTHTNSNDISSFFQIIIIPIGLATTTSTWASCFDSEIMTDTSS